MDAVKVYRKTLHTAFDNGITHFDLANNYGPPPELQVNFGKYCIPILKRTGMKTDHLYQSRLYHVARTLRRLGFKKYLVSSLDQSLKRMKLDYVDGRPITTVRIPMLPWRNNDCAGPDRKTGKAFIWSISNYRAPEAKKAIAMLRKLGTLPIHRLRILCSNVGWKGGLLDLLERKGVGCIPFSPLAQGLLTSKYCKGIPKIPVRQETHGFTKEAITKERVQQIQQLNELAKATRANPGANGFSMVIEEMKE